MHKLTLKLMRLSKFMNPHKLLKKTDLTEDMWAVVAEVTEEEESTRAINGDS